MELNSIFLMRKFLLIPLIALFALPTAINSETIKIQKIQNDLSKKERTMALVNSSKKNN